MKPKYTLTNAASTATQREGSPKKRSDYKENKRRESKTEDSKTDDKGALQEKPKKKRNPKFQKHEPRNEEEGRAS